MISMLTSRKSGMPLSLNMRRVFLTIDSALCRPFSAASRPPSMKIEENLKPSGNVVDTL